MVRHLIITWLVISILGYGMAIAADVHDEETQVMTVGDVTHLHDDPHTLPAHDQCGHGSFHLLAIQ